MFSSRGLRRNSELIRLWERQRCQMAVFPRVCLVFVLKMDSFCRCFQYRYSPLRKFCTVWSISYRAELPSRNSERLPHVLLIYKKKSTVFQFYCFSCGIVVTNPYNLTASPGGCKRSVAGDTQQHHVWPSPVRPAGTGARLRGVRHHVPTGGGPVCSRVSRDHRQQDPRILADVRPVNELHCTL